MRKKTIKIPIYGGKLTIVIDKDLTWVQNKFKTPSLENFGAVTLKDETQYRHYVVAFEYSTGSDHFKIEEMETRIDRKSQNGR